MSTSVNFNVLATIDDPIDGVLDVSATAIFYISETDIQNIFKAQTDSEDFTICRQQILSISYLWINGHII